MNPFTQELKRLNHYRNRWKRCHELAGMLIIEMESDDLLLVQGKLFGLIEHSWIEHAPSGNVLDPVRAEVFESNSYDGTAVRKYTRKEACREISAEGAYTYFWTTRRTEDPSLPVDPWLQNRSPKVAPTRSTVSSSATSFGTSRMRSRSTRAMSGGGSMRSASIQRTSLSR
jgi:hypothetical protein